MEIIIDKLPGLKISDVSTHPVRDRRVSDTIDETLILCFTCMGAIAYIEDNGSSSLNLSCDKGRRIKRRYGEKAYTSKHNFNSKPVSPQHTACDLRKKRKVFLSPKLPCRLLRHVEIVRDALVEKSE